ncbi:sodium-dependent transporter [Paenibacillus sp. GSMTC-2017]|uniref:sodium-dependent transporter n=1 Tax=Paenibacillus sp. GSMTC-2017 TaxID=2794350 RepID=UPI0018D6AD61|nr:sodium-dependent transporter [Paenibacillus sp. GSMTC-2017]MBH5319820.1 sodium-dependent transporter [Paenibacillus sp. GSMTC-2017]
MGKNKKKEQFTSVGFIMAAIGSAVGLGNMWKFPYITGIYGGAAFFILFLFCLLLVGLPILLAEMSVGRAGRGNPVASMMKLGGKKWGALGFLSVAGSFLIMSFYGVVAGWTLHYALLSFTGDLFSTNDFSGLYKDFIGGWMPIGWQFIVMLITAYVLIKGVSSGIERFNKILIPGLVILLVLLAIQALSLPGAGQGVSFFLKPDFSKLTAESALVALGQAFFSMSLGMGTMITYGAYVQKSQSLGGATVAVGLGNVLYALLAGLIIFPTIFVYGIEPSEGPGLVFIALPAAFSAMPLGAIFGGLFFVLLAFAAITSAISVLEVSVAFAMDYFGWKRPMAVIIVASLCFLAGVPAALSLGGQLDWLVFGGKPLFDWMDFLGTNILLPLNGLILTIFVGFVWKGAAEESGLTSMWFRIWLFMLRFVAPILVLLVLLYSTGIIKL